MLLISTRGARWEHWTRSRSIWICRIGRRATRSYVYYVYEHPLASHDHTLFQDLSPPASNGAFAAVAEWEDVSAGDQQYLHSMDLAMDVLVFYPIEQEPHVFDHASAQDEQFSADEPQPSQIADVDPDDFAPADDDCDCQSSGYPESGECFFL